MKILQINNFHYLFSGTERYYFDLSELLEKRGNKVAFFSVKNPKNTRTNWNKYFLEYISYKNPGLSSIPAILSRFVYSVEARRKIGYLIDNFKPDIAHIHTIDLYISPSIILELKKRHIPIVYTLHNYQLLAPTSGSLFHNGKICEITKPHSYYKAIFHKCIRNSYRASAAYVIKQYMHHILGVFNHIDIFLAPSNFIRNKFIEYGFNQKKIVRIPNFTQYQQNYSESSSLGKYILYFGRLSREKGLETLIEVMRELPDIKLKLVGSGPLLRDLLHKKSTYKLKNVEFIPQMNGSVLKFFIRKCRFSVLPSMWYEVFPMAILESFACGKTVIASNIGGIPELVHDKRTGLLFEPGNVRDLTKKISFLWSNVRLLVKLEQTAYEYINQNYSQEMHYEKIHNVYTRLIEIGKTGGSMS